MSHRADAHWVRRIILAVATALATIVVVKAWAHPPAACWTSPGDRPEWSADVLDG